MKNFRRLILCLAFMHGAYSSLKSQSAIVDYNFIAAPPNNLVNKMLLQPDGKILVGGAFTNYAGSGHNNFVRLNVDGTIDTTFNSGGSGPSNAVYDIGLMPDGRIVISGNFTMYNSVPCSFVIRLNANGSVDNSFVAQANVINNAIWALEIQADEKVVIAGDFSYCFSNSQPHITRLNYNGSLDTSFHVGVGFNNSVYDLLLLPDQRILCGGKFVTYQGQPNLGISLLFPNGTQDTSMSVSNAFSDISTAIVHSLTRQPDGKIIVSGAFSYHNSQPITGITRLNINGTRDLSFTPPLYPYAIVRTTALQADNKILAGGEFTTTMYNPNINGSNKIVRLNTNGTIDTTFHVGTAFQNQYDFVNDIKVQPDTKILVGGNFTYFDSEIMYHHIIRLYESTPLFVEEQEQGALNIFPNPSSSGFNIENPSDDGSDVQVVIYNMQGEIVFSEVVTSPREKIISLETGLPAGMYFMRVENSGRVFGQKVIVAE